MHTAVVRVQSIVPSNRSRPDDTVGRVPTTLTLDHAARHVRRTTLTCDDGTRVALDLPQAMHLAHGDRLMTADGGIVVRAAAEPLLEAVASDGMSIAALAWHLGNRHTPAQIEGERILVPRDPVLARMLGGLGASVREVEEPFEPVRGAYHSHGDRARGHHAHEHHSHEHRP